MHGTVAIVERVLPDLKWTNKLSTMNCAYFHLVLRCKFQIDFIKDMFFLVRKSLIDVTFK